MRPCARLPVHYPDKRITKAKCGDHELLRASVDAPVCEISEMMFITMREESTRGRRRLEVEKRITAFVPFLLVLRYCGARCACSQGYTQVYACV